jgi:menaquinol-cytochrome c reductase iron-sulfur subunit
MRSTDGKNRGVFAAFADVVRGVRALVTGLWAVLTFIGSSQRRQPEEPMAEVQPTQPPSAVDEPESPERRRFLATLTVATGAGIGAVASLPAIAFLLAPLTRDEKAAYRDVGPVGLYPMGTTTKVVLDDPSALPWAGVAGQQAAWLRHNEDDTFTAFAINCTHLGCPIHWLPDAKLFMCPCHGGVFYEDGTVASAPPQEPLAQHRVRVTNGQVEIETRAVKITGDILKGIND